MNRHYRYSGFSLLEMVFVVAILVVLAGLVLPMLSGVQDSSASTATNATLQSIRTAIVGAGPGQAGYLSDMGKLPATIRDLFVMPAGATAFNPLTGRGWRGPYLRDASGAYQVSTGLGFSGIYGTAGDPAVLDGWGRPIVIQSPTVTDSGQRALFTRLVSAGPDGSIQTLPDSLYPLPTDRGDDVVVFLMRADIAP